MARRLIGLDIGTNAVRVAEIELGEPAAAHQLRTGRAAARRDRATARSSTRPPVTAAIQRLWKELSLARATGARRRRQPAGARAHGRPARRCPTTSSPAPCNSRPRSSSRSRSRTRSSTSRCSRTSRAGSAGRRPAAASPMQRYLLAAAHKDLVANLVAAVRAAGLDRLRGRPRPARARPLGRPSGLGQRQRASRRS